MDSLIARITQDFQRTQESAIPLLLASRATHICGTTDPQETFETVLFNIQVARKLGYVEKLPTGEALCDRYVNLVFSVELDGYASKEDWFRETIIKRMYSNGLHLLVHSYFGAYEINWMHHCVIEKIMPSDMFKQDNSLMAVTA
ncbi:hypothetical protein [Synechocystis sp. LKSZ1]|uniref:hypothetical protein n=1 Tax=Synechocystis sp. LKSZ1 TaxID=3144951 RepID=UPI00336BEEF7